MGANINRRGAEGGKFTEQLLAIGGIRVIGFVIAEIVPDGEHGSIRLVGVHVDVYVLGRLLRTARENWGKQKCQDPNETVRSSHLPPALQKAVVI